MTKFLFFIWLKHEHTHCMEKQMALNLNLINACYLIGHFVRFIHFISISWQFRLSPWQPLGLANTLHVYVKAPVHMRAQLN